jgi:hypothetical protein
MEGNTQRDAGDLDPFAVREGVKLRSRARGPGAEDQPHASRAIRVTGHGTVEAVYDFAGRNDLRTITVCRRRGWPTRNEPGQAYASVSS